VTVVATPMIEDLTQTARSMVESAVAVATGRLKAESPSEVRALVACDDQPALEYFRHELAHQIAMLVMLADHNVIAVYLEHDLPEAEECAPPDLRLADPIQLVLNVERETAALSGLVRAIDRAICGVVASWRVTECEGFITATMVQPSHVHRLRARVNGYRPAPSLLVSRQN
jgi:hypothetical protein